MLYFVPLKIHSASFVASFVDLAGYWPVHVLWLLLPTLHADTCMLGIYVAIRALVLECIGMRAGNRFNSMGGNLRHTMSIYRLISGARFTNLSSKIVSI